jgi:hypothetical protein
LLARTLIRSLPNDANDRSKALKKSGAKNFQEYSLERRH